MKALAWFLAFFVGFLSLSQEILWVRAVSFLHQGVPQAFALVLGLFLLGVAAGSAAAKRVCTKNHAPLGVAALVMFLSGVGDILAPWTLATLVHGPFSLLGISVFIFFTAALKSAVFPIAHQLGSEQGKRMGRSLSRVYFMNIMGSTLGPLLTGFVLLDYLSLSAAFQLIGLGGLLVSAVILVFINRKLVVAVFILFLGVIVLFFEPHDDALVRRMAGETEGFYIRHVLENRYGILHVADDGGEGDVVFGGNVYDGRINIDLLNNSNKIDRAYILSVLNEAPRKVLVIGLSTGAWTRVVSAMPEVESIDVVEINPGYLELISRYSDVAPLLEDSRVNINIDDGRRWLKRHPDKKFDLIVMNTSFHWRAHSTNLLSREFMGMARSHLAPGGMIAFNATGSGDAFYTASQVFPFAYRWGNFIYASDRDFRSLKSEYVLRPFSLRLNEGYLLDIENSRHRQAVLQMLRVPFSSVAEDEVSEGRSLEVITDDNMINEFKYGRGL